MTEMSFTTFRTYRTNFYCLVLVNKFFDDKTAKISANPHLFKMQLCKICVGYILFQLSPKKALFG